MQSNFYTTEELKTLGLKSFGTDVLISRKCSIYGASNINIGNHVRIDDFCILSGNITIGNYVHIGANTLLFGGNAGISLADFSGLSSRCAIYAATDDYSGASMTNPTIPEKYRNITSAKVSIEKHCIVGTGSTVLPGVTLKEGCAVGAMSLIMKSTLPWKIYFGVPARTLSERKKDLLELEKKFMEKIYG